MLPPGFPTGGQGPKDTGAACQVRLEHRTLDHFRRCAQKFLACRRPQLPAGIKPAALAALANALAVLPAHAEAGKIFDFNLTLPIMTVQFLLLMVFLDKTWFTPVGKALDDRDATLRAKLGSVKDNSGDLKKLQDEAEKVLREARQEAQALIKEAKSKTQEEQGKKLAETKAVGTL